MTRSLVIAVGVVLAAVISYNHQNTTGWIIIDGALNWAYVVFFLISHYVM
jgi:hypothetical protein